MELPINQIIQGHVLDVIKQFPDNSIDVVVTSPPYWALRVYGGEETKVQWNDGWYGQLGLEPHPQMFINHLTEIFREIKRILKLTGSFWLNMGDTYYTKSRTNFRGSCEELSAKEDTDLAIVNQIRELYRSSWLQSKQKLMIPERVAIALQEDGWILRNTIIWYKKNHMPSSVKDRLTNSYEYIYFFVKNRKYYFNLDAIREPIAEIAIKKYQYPISTLSNIINRKPLLNGKYVDLSGRYKGKFNGLGKEAELFGSPRARVHRHSKFLKTDVKTASPAARALKTLESGKLTTFVKKKLLDVGAYLKRKKKESGLSFQELSRLTGIKQTTLEHYFRTDLSGQALPDRKTWELLKPLLRLDEYNNYISEEIKNALPQLHPLGRNPTDVWEINTQPSNDYWCSNCKRMVLINNGLCRICGTKITSHFAVYPEQLVERILKCSCPMKGIVLDPFIGSGTTAIVAKKLGLNYIGIDINPTYCEMAKWRLTQIPEKIEKWFK